jgi:hypothetical protein
MARANDPERDLTAVGDENSFHGVGRCGGGRKSGSNYGFMAGRPAAARLRIREESCCTTGC